MRKNIFIISLAALLLTACTAKNHAGEGLSTTVISEKSDALHQYTTVASETIAKQEIDASGSVEKQLKITPSKTLDGEICLLITNNSNSIIDELEVQINYKNSSGNTIDTDKDGHDMILPGSTVASKMSAPKDYSDYEIVSDIELDCHPSYKNHSGKVSISTNSGDSCVIVEITNNDDVTIDEIEYIVVFYKGDDIAHVGYPQDVTDVDPGKTVTEKVPVYGFDYDKYEVYLNQAHTF